MNRPDGQIPLADTPSKGNSLSGQAGKSALRQSMGAFLRFLSVAGVFYLALLAVYLLLPGIRPGAEQIASAKTSYVRHNHLFREDATCRVLVCGTSKVLSGFQPLLFDRLAGSNVSSFNLGMPGSDAFITELETLVARGETPTHVVLTQPWGTNDVHDFGAVLRSDDQLMQTLFPFRGLPRNLILFAMQSPEYGGLRSYYRRGLGLVEQMLLDRGYYFIESFRESRTRYAGHRLPDNYRFEGDNPSLIRERELLTTGPITRRLGRAMNRGRFKVFLAPSFYREGEAAVCPPNRSAQARLASVGVRLCGPDYWLFPPRFFSDREHLNSEGSREYTQRLWHLLGPMLAEPAALPGRERD